MEVPATAIGVIVCCVVVRQVDRWWFGAGRTGDVVRTASAVLAVQRSRANDLTPTVLLLSVWLEIAGWGVLLLTPRSVWGAVGFAAVLGLQLRRLQEITHFGVHGVLARSRRANEVLTDVFFQAPVGLSHLTDRRRTHVREHHPNATNVDLDPNRETLSRAGLRPGMSRRGFLGVVLFPLTPTGLAAAVAEYLRNLRRGGVSWVFAAAVLPVSVSLLGGVNGFLWGFLVARFAVYPALAWLSLLVEHRWCQPVAMTGAADLDEAARCLRLYPRGPIRRALARATWLPYGDLFHYAHSRHPAVRWNYLNALDRLLPRDAAEFDRVVGRRSVLSSLYREGTSGSLVAGSR